MPDNTTFFMSPSPGPDSKRQVQRFSHNAMGTIFEIIFSDCEPGQASQVSKEAFDELDRLERDLSHFIPSSDISRINSLKAGEFVRVGLDAFECLKDARRSCAETYGAFDVTIGPLYKLWRDAYKSGQSPTAEQIAEAKSRTSIDYLKIDEETHSVGVAKDGVTVDLGGIGKGYAVDRMVELLRDWGIESALVHGGQSTVYALGQPKGEKAWMLLLRYGGPDTEVPMRVFLKNQALSGSGAVLRGPHIIDPRTCAFVPASYGAWSVADLGVDSDVLSTTFIILSDEEITRYCSEHPGVSGLRRTGEGESAQMKRFGVW